MPADTVDTAGDIVGAPDVEIELQVCPGERAGAVNAEPQPTQDLPVFALVLEKFEGHGPFLRVAVHILKGEQVAVVVIVEVTGSCHNPELITHPDIRRLVAFCVDIRPVPDAFL